MNPAPTHGYIRAASDCCGDCFLTSTGERFWVQEDRHGDYTLSNFGGEAILEGRSYARCIEWLDDPEREWNGDIQELLADFASEILEHTKSPDFGELDVRRIGDHAAEITRLCQAWNARMEAAEKYPELRPEAAAPELLEAAE